MSTVLDGVVVTGFASAAAEAAAIPLGSNAFKVGVNGLVCCVPIDGFIEAELKLNAVGLVPVAGGVVVANEVKVFDGAVDLMVFDPNGIAADVPDPPKDWLGWAGFAFAAVGTSGFVNDDGDSVDIPKDLLADPPNIEVPPDTPKGVDGDESDGALNPKPEVGCVLIAKFVGFCWPTDCCAVVVWGVLVESVLDIGATDVVTPKGMSIYI